MAKIVRSKAVVVSITAFFVQAVAQRRLKIAV
jgi:hypothetical protein